MFPQKNHSQQKAEQKQGKQCDDDEEEEKKDLVAGIGKQFRVVRLIINRN